MHDAAERILCPVGETGEVGAWTRSDLRRYLIVGAIAALAVLVKPLTSILVEQTTDELPSSYFVRLLDDTVGFIGQTALAALVAFFVLDRWKVLRDREAAASREEVYTDQVRRYIGYELDDLRTGVTSLMIGVTQTDDGAVLADGGDTWLYQSFLLDRLGEMRLGKLSDRDVEVSFDKAEAVARAHFHRWSTERYSPENRKTVAMGIKLLPAPKFVDPKSARELLRRARENLRHFNDGGLSLVVDSVEELDRYLPVSDRQLSMLASAALIRKSVRSWEGAVDSKLILDLLEAKADESRPLSDWESDAYETVWDAVVDILSECGTLYRIERALSREYDPTRTSSAASTD